ncbi:hypothetical protein [Streptomyces sp. NPDC059701]|uniref:hypothetical protein n=1 Tax=Streptomyces sp. NPDC059701 TaxID=3346914 RepID=UPI003696CB63
MAGAVGVDPEPYDAADALVVDRGEDGPAPGQGETVEAVQDGVPDLLAGRGDDQDAVDRGAARVTAGLRHADVDRRLHGSERALGA